MNLSDLRKKLSAPRVVRTHGEPVSVGFRHGYEKSTLYWCEMCVEPALFFNLHAHFDFLHLPQLHPSHVEDSHTSAETSATRKKVHGEEEAPVDGMMKGFWCAVCEDVRHSFHGHFAPDPEHPGRPKLDFVNLLPSASR